MCILKVFGLVRSGALAIAVFAISFVGVCSADEVDTVIDDLIAFKLRSSTAVPSSEESTANETRQTAPRKSAPRISTEQYKAEILTQSHADGVIELTTLYFPRMGGASFQVTVIKADNELTAKNNSHLKDLARFDLANSEPVAGMMLRSSPSEDLLFILDVSATAFLRIQPSHPLRHQQLLDFSRNLPIKELIRLQ